MKKFDYPVLFRPKDEKDRKGFIAWLEAAGWNVWDDCHNSLCIVTGTVSACGAVCGATYLYPFTCCGRVDCGSNIELAKALSALRSDSDYMQWFTDGHHWHICPEEKARMGAFNDYYHTQNCHKATKDEIIQRFKTE